MRTHALRNAGPKVPYALRTDYRTGIYVPAIYGFNGKV